MPPLFADRAAAGRALADAVGALELEGEVVVEPARGGVVVAAEVARALDRPLDVVAVRKIGHPDQPESAIGAVAPGDGVLLREVDGLDEPERTAAVEPLRPRYGVFDPVEDDDVLRLLDELARVD